VKAKVAGHEFTFRKVDWSQTTQRKFKFDEPDFVLSRKDVDLDPHISMVYEISKYSLDTQEYNPEYAFAVQPLFVNKRDQL